MKKHKTILYIISQEIFIFSSLIYFILLLVEIIKKDLVTFFFNPDILLIFIFTSCIISVMTYSDKHSGEKNHKTVSSILIAMVSLLIVIGGTVFVFMMTEMLGVMSLFLTAIAGMILFLFSLLVFMENPRD